MHSLEALRVINDRAALKGSRQKFDRKTGQLRNATTNEISTSRTFFTAVQAKKFCEDNGAQFAGFAK